MTEHERETAGAVRSAHVAHFFAPDWAQAAQRASGALERIDKTIAAPQVLVTVPDAPAALAVARELRALPAGAGIRVLPITGAARAGRLLNNSPAQVIVGTPAVLAELLAASALKVDAIHTTLLISADEYEAQHEALGTLMAELPRGSARILTAGTPSPLVEDLIERYLHKARRVTGQEPLPAPVPPGTPPTIYVRTVMAGATLAPLAELLDELDPPSVALVVGDSRTEGQAHSALEALGYTGDASLAQVTRGEVALHTALVLFVGLPDSSAIAAALGAHPARMVALITARQRDALTQVTKGVVLMPYERSRAARTARGRDEGMRSALRAVLAEGLAYRETLALEPLLAEFDGLEIAGAALRLYERAQAEVTNAKLAGREEIRQEMKAARAEAKEESRPPREQPRSFDRPRGERSRPPRGDGPPRERSFGGPPRGERPPRSDSPRGDSPRGERSFSGPPRGDKPFSRGPRPSGDGARGPRGPRRDDGGRPPKRER